MKNENGESRTELLQQKYCEQFGEESPEPFDERFASLRKAYAIRVEDTLDWYGVFYSYATPEMAAVCFYSLAPKGFVLADR